MIQIDKNVPLPLRGFGQKGGRPPKYPWSNMEIGDSFFIAGRSQNSVSAQANWAAKRRGVTFTTRKETGGVRVWRIA